MSMIQCDLCKSALPAHSLFCGRCGRAIKSVAAATDISSGNLQLPTSRGTATSGISAWNVSTNSYPMQGKQTLSDHDMSIIYGDEEREEIAQQPARPLNSETDADFLPILGGAIRPVQGNIPIVSGTPQPGGVPSVQGTPQMPDSRAAQSASQRILQQHPHPGQSAPQQTAHQHPQAPHQEHQHLQAPHQEQSQATPSHHKSSQATSSQPTHHLHTSNKPRPAAGGYTQVLLVTIVAVTLIVAGIIGAGFTILSPALSLSGSTNVVWGQSIHLHGSHFIPGSIVVLTLDGTQPLYYASREPAIQASSDTNTNTAAALAMLVSQISQIDASKNTLVVSANGTFDVTINVSSNWPAGHHTIRATEKLSQRSAVLNFSVQQSGPTPIPSTSTPIPSTSTPTPTPTPTPCVSVRPGTLSFTAVVANGNPQAQTVTVSNCASAAGKWTASPNANWLTVNPMGGTLDGGATQQVQIAVSLGSLGVGTYTGSIVFRLGSSQSTVNVTFTLQAPCVSAKPETLTFTGVVANSDPQPQIVTVSNCGSAAGNWSASPNANWLTVNLTNGTLNGGATQHVNVAVSLANLKIGTYNGDIVFTLGSSQSTVHVTLTVKQQTACIQANPHLLDLDSGNKITITNCGDAGTWSPSISTDDGSNWLGLHQTGGPLDGGVSQDVYTQLRLRDVAPGKTYTAHITFTITTNSGAQHSVTVDVKFTEPVYPVPT